ncbi:unnamed protein product [Moneuplotes crassus]|uniref:SWIM-type domain-containing protein n=1 Tax=Euplotes crassus TaxID=5936 RepID=A0AAD1XRK7_EUPCR|nr:unnamed protein product [Moneuplotes crassus]
MKINSKKMKIQEFLLNIQHIGQAIFVRDSQDQDSGHQWLRQLLENGSTKEVYSSTRLNCLKRDASYYGISLALDQIAKSLGTEIDEVKRGKLFFIKDKKGEYCVEKVSVNRIECNCSFNRTHDSFCSHIYSVLHHKGYEINNFECLNHQFKHCKTKYPSFFTVVRENKVAPKSRRSGDKAARKKEKALTEANLSKLGEETVQEKMRAREKDILRDTSNSLPNIDPKDISVKGKKRIVKEMMKGVEKDDFISGTKLSDEDSKPNLQDELLEAVNYDKQDNVLDQSRAQECIKKVINYR